MSPDDPRHGTEAGEAQHLRDNETPCDACTRADILASRRRTKRKTMGYRYTRPIGEANHAKLARLKDDGARWEDLADWAGISPSQAWRILDGGPETVVYARTFIRVASMKEGRIVTAVGITRRIRALCWLGHSPARIAAEAGVCEETVRDARDQVRVFVAAKVRDGIADAYDRLNMVLPAATTSREKASVTRVRNHARAQHWDPPLSWDDIDRDPEPPTHDNADAIDDVLVERILGGEWRLRATPAERTEVVRRWVAAGRSVRQLARASGWKTERYYKVGEDAA